MNRKKLFEVMRGFGVQGILVDVIERIYDGNMVKFEIESVTFFLGRDQGLASQNLTSFEIEISQSANDCPASF